LGTENSLAGINLESTWGDKWLKIFWVRNWQTLAGLREGALSCNNNKISRAERSRTNPLNALQEAIHYFFIKFCINCFTLWYEFFAHYALRAEKIINMVLMRDFWNLNFFGRGVVSLTPSQTCRFVSGS
jgi:hypothetical protein